MKMDMHCHTKEGSLDGKVPIEEYICTLKQMGFGGMLVSDHNSYNGYRYWKKHIKNKRHTDFVVLKGIEYDTINAGHILVVMPEGIKINLLELRGLPVSLLIDVVHRYGGILGPAHPCGEKYLSITNTRYYKKHPKIMGKFDFLEAFNSCEPPEANAKAKKLADQYDLACFGGSDSHRANCIGTAYTKLPDEVESESDLIACVMKRRTITAGGTYYLGTTKAKIGKVNNVLVQTFWLYNKTSGLVRRHKRMIELRKKEQVRE